MKIFNRFSRELIGDFEIANGANLYNANFYNANLQYADLCNANLCNANFYNANLQYADLQYADLQNANLQNANLQNANLQNADLQYANLQNADLQNIRINWNSHDLIAEILRQAAQDDIEKRSLAGLILISRDFCWKDFLAIAHPQKEWAMATLRKFETEDNAMPRPGNLSP